MNIYVGNLPYSVTEDELRSMFTQHGEVIRATIIIDKFSGQSKGFGFVEMSDGAQAESAIAALNESEVKGRNIKVNPAKPREERPRRNRF
ncbi:RNA recognition motif domain-containing protein [Algicola sagamiensis]|uniref:RNA recognition motif domain-containing protein n=1 Tax=Algicola sagamiensis TaxID=163869 RepID=UPI000367618F|nr:RNA-binding protein [Algicola sagamiensis]